MLFQRSAAPLTTHLESDWAQVILPVVQIFHCAAVLVSEGVEEEPLHDATLANPRTPQDHQTDSLVIAHAGVCTHALSYLPKVSHCTLEWNQQHVLQRRCHASTLTCQYEHSHT